MILLRNIHSIALMIFSLFLVLLSSMLVVVVVHTLQVLDSTFSADFEQENLPSEHNFLTLSIENISIDVVFNPH